MDTEGNFFWNPHLGDPLERLHRPNRLGFGHMGNDPYQVSSLDASLSHSTKRGPYEGWERDFPGRGEKSGWARG
jgi:hypothetical protein